ncbi:hypothetical protein STENM223S_04896 [Streptomyces tendae]
MTTETTTSSATTAVAKIPSPATPYQQDIARYWNNEARPVNLRLGDVDGLYHHHYGIGAVDRAALATRHSEYEKKVIAELHRLESAQAEFLMDHLGEAGPGDTLADAGCTRRLHGHGPPPLRLPGRRGHAVRHPGRVRQQPRA